MERAKDENAKIFILPLSGMITAYANCFHKHNEVRKGERAEVAINISVLSGHALGGQQRV